MAPTGIPVGWLRQDHIRDAENGRTVVGRAGADGGQARRRQVNPEDRLLALSPPALDLGISLPNQQGIWGNLSPIELVVPVAL